MKNKKLLLVSLAAMMLLGCGKSDDSNEDDYDIHDRFEEEESEEKEDSDEIEEDEDKSDEKSDNEMRYIGEIPLLSEDDDPDGLDMYFQYEGNTRDDYIYISSLTLVNGKNKDKVDECGFNYSEISGCYDLVTDDNREYIFLDVAWGNDYYDIYEFDITKGNAEYIGEIGHVHSYVDELNSGAPDFSDPDNILIADVSGALGTCICYDYYHIGEDGSLESNTTGAIISHVSSESITSNTAMELEVVDADGNLTGEKITVPSGSTFVPVRTNLDDWIDAEVNGGTTIRLHYTYDYDSYEYLINGSNIEDIFSGIMYVG